MSPLLHRALLSLSAIGSLLLIFWLLKYSAYGFDFTDEGFSLVWLSNPFVYQVSSTQFGFVYYPLYTLLDGDIASLRRANILITYALASFLVYVLLPGLGRDVDHGRPARFVASLGIATSIFICFDRGVTTPNYNSLTLQALLLAATGLVLCEKHFSRRSIVGWILIAVGGWLAFMAKPTAAAALALGVMLCLLLSDKFSLKMSMLLALTVVMLLVLSALLIDGSIIVFVKRLQLGFEFAQLLAAGHDPFKMLRLDDFSLTQRMQYGVFLVASLLLAAMLSLFGN